MFTRNIGLHHAIAARTNEASVGCHASLYGAWNCRVGHRTFAVNGEPVLAKVFPESAEFYRALLLLDPMWPEPAKFGLESNGVGLRRADFGA